MSRHSNLKRIGVIPCMRVGYKIVDLLESLFVWNASRKYRKKLEDKIALYFGCDNVMMTSSGRGAIYLILKSLSQRKVVVPAYTCEVVIEACKMAQKEIVFAHVDRVSLNVSTYPEIDNDTVVIATHQYGLPCDMKSLMILCKEKGAILIEDCAGSFGTKIDGQLTGTLGDIGVFSFSASKTFNSPTKGGFIIAKNGSLLRQIETSSNTFPSDAKFQIFQTLKGIGFCLNNCRYLTSFFCRFANTKEFNNGNEYLNDPIYKRGFYEWQAFVVLKQFEHLDVILTTRQKMFEEYDSRIDNPLIQKPLFNKDAVNIRYAIQIKDRNSFLSYCKANNIQVGKGYKKLMCPDSYRDEREISNNVVYLPFGSNYSKREIQKVISVVNSYK